MRLLYVNADPGIPVHGPKGASVHVRQITAALARQGTSVEVVAGRRGTPEGEAVPQESGDGVRILVPESSPAPHSETTALREADALLRDETLARLLDARLARGDIDVIWERYSLWSTAAANAAARTGIPWVLEVNAPLAQEAARHRSLALPGLAGYLQRERWRNASFVLAVSRELAKTIVETGADPARVRVLPNGYDGALFRPRGRDVGAGAGATAAPDAPFTVAFVGSLKPWHGVDLLVEAFLRLRAEDAAWRLLLIGDGPLAAPIRRRLEQAAPAGSFEMTGAVPHGEVPARLATAEVATAPYPSSDDFYFSPLKVIEYAALGLPIVASRIGQIAELLEDGTSALLTEPGDVDALAAALRRVRADAGLRIRLGSAAHGTVRNHTWDSVAARALAWIAELTPGSGAPAARTVATTSVAASFTEAAR